VAPHAFPDRMDRRRCASGACSTRRICAVSLPFTPGAVGACVSRGFFTTHRRARIYRSGERLISRLLQRPHFIKEQAVTNHLAPTENSGFGGRNA
jgi:hypothetical protein